MAFLPHHIQESYTFKNGPVFFWPTLYNMVTKWYDEIKHGTHIRLTTFARPNSASVFGVTRHIMFGASTDSVRRALISRGASGV